jgi:N-acylneuraminate cytidylyltransferase
MNLAIIPARGGSKRILRKNTRKFCGQPIIGYSIQKAIESQLFDRIIVSTDCEQIADVARQFGSEVPFIRPAELANDHAGTMDVVRHAIDFGQKNWGQIDNVCCIYATAPLMSINDLKTGRSLLEDDANLEFAFSVTTFASPIFRALQIKAGQTQMFWPEYLNTRSQDLEEAYHDAAQFYWGRSEAFQKHNHLYTARSAPVVLPRFRVVDIDTPEDWVQAEMLYDALRQAEALKHVSDSPTRIRRAG